MKMDPEPQVHMDTSTVNGPSFLGLSAEVRNMVYRLLLVADKPLGISPQKRISLSKWATFGEYHLQPAILGVCQQVYREASPFLNRENTFGILIDGDEDPEYEDDEWDDRMDREACMNEEYEVGFVNHGRATTHFMDVPLEIRCKSFGRWSGSYGSYFQSHKDIIGRFQRLEVLIAYAEPLAIRFHAKTLCNSVLRSMTALQHISIRVICETTHIKSTALGPFGLLRNMRSVVIQGVPPRFAKRLRGLMLGNTPSEDVEAMYDVLDDYYVKDQNANRFYVKEAFMAMMDWDIPKFKKKRAKILADGQSRLDFALLNIFEHDAKSEENHDGTTGEDHDGTTGEDRDGKLGDR